MSNVAYSEYSPEALNPPTADELLRLYRQRSGLTQDQLANQLGFGSKRMVRKWEDSQSLPEPVSLRKIIEFYMVQNIFVKGKELQEALQLWETVKNSYEAGGVKPRIYPLFDQSWFDSLSVPSSNTAVTTLPGPLIAPIPDVTPDNNLPAPLNSFVGRKKEMQELAPLLPATRCLSLVGTGGIGKTRLALELAKSQKENFKEGIWFIELAALATSEQVIQAVARVLQVSEKPRQSLLASVTNFLWDKEILLVLDNCEHLVQECAALAGELLGYCPTLKILATSRERFRIAGEVTWHVPALSLPNLKQISHSEDVPSIESGENGANLLKGTLPDAVALFVERVQAVRVDFSLDNRNSLAVFELCQTLEGLPLAIELAAVRTRLLSITQINTRLSERFKLLTEGSKAALPRQQTLQALIDWSYDLLDEKEQKLFARLSVFAGGFSLEAVEAVCAGEGVETGEIVALLIELIARSLVTARRSGQAMLYNQLETLRQYGQSRLKSGGQLDYWNERHFDYYLNFVARQQGGLKNRNQKETAALIEREYLNCQKALNYILDRNNKAAALRLCEALSFFWELRSYLTEGKFLVNRSLEIPGPIDKIQKARALTYLGRFCEIQGDYKTGLEYALEGQELSRESGDASVIATNLTLLGNLNMWLGNNKLARGYFNQSLELHRKQKSNLGIALILGNMGRLAMVESNYQTAIKLSLEALELNRKLGFDHGASRVINTLGIVSIEQGNFEAARNYYEESARMSKALGNREMEASILTNLGNVAFRQGNYDKARATYLESLTLHKAVGNKGHAANVLTNLGEMSGTLGDYTSARQYTLEALAIKREIGDRLVQAICLNNLGNFATNLGDYKAALAYCQESLTIRQEINNLGGVAFCYRNLGDLASVQDNFEAAREYYRQGLEIQRGVGDIPAIITLLDKLALLSAKQRQTQAEVYLLEAVQLSREVKNQLNVAYLLAVTVILWAEQPDRTALVAQLIPLVEALVSASGGVLEQVYLQPYTTARLKFQSHWADTTGETGKNEQGTELTEDAHTALRQVALELQAGKT